MKKFFSLFAAVLFAGSMVAAEAVLQYTGSTTTNMVGNGTNNAATLGLDENLFTVLADKGANQNFPGLNKAGDIRLYADKDNGNGNSIIVSIASGTINSIVLDIKQTATFVVKAGETAVTEEEGAYAINATSFSIQNITTGATTQLQLNKITITYTPGEEPKVATPVIAGDAEFTDSVIVTITCTTPEADIYYTTDGTTDPKCDCAAAPEYKHALVIKETTTIKAAAYTGNDWSAVAEKTFTKKEKAQPITCAEVYNKAKNDEVALNDVVVTYANGKNVYVKDATGAMLVYLTANTSWNAGDVLSGVEGTVDIYNNLYEVKPTAAQVAAVTATPGEAPAPEELTKAPVAGEMNKFVLLKNVTVSAETFPSNKNMNCTIGDETFVLRNNFNADVAFDTLKTYDITGVVAVYNATVQVYFINAEEVKDEPVSDWTEIAFDHAVLADSLPADAVFEFDGLKVAITDTDNKMAIDANDARFGTAEAYNMLNYRLKTGGKSSSKNLITVSVPADGKLRLAVRTGSNSATNRNLVIAQGTDTLYNQIILESQAVEAVEGEDTVKVYPYVEVEVKKGDIVLTYPVGSLNFYAFAFQSNQAPETTWTVAGSSAAVFGTAWDPKNTTNDMFKVEEGQYNWSKSGLELAAGEIEFKVVKDHAWTEAYPEQNYKLKLDSAGIYTITISFDEAKKEVSALAIKTGEAVVLPKVEIKGSWKDGKYDSSWNGGAAYEFTVAEDKKTASYILKLDEVHEYEFGFQFDGSWKANGAVITREANTTNLAEGSGNMKLNADQAGKYEFVYTFETQALVVNYPKPIQTYEVAEAIAAGLAENDEINVRGIITKMEFKGKNFAKYGSVNIYVKDATGAEGEFEFYNCYSLNADTFRTSTPAYDPESTAWAEFAEVADANGNAIHVGDTVIAFGKYKLYNTTYELNTGCYLIDIKHGTPAEADTIKLEFNNGMVLNMYYEDYGSSDVLFTNIPVDEAGELVGDGDYLDLSIFPEDPNNVAGLYSSAEEYENFDLEYSYLLRINGTDTLEYEFVEAVAAIVIGETSREQGIAELAIEAKLATAEGLVFELAYTGLVAYDFIDEQGLEEIMSETNGKVLKIMHEGQVFILKDNKLYNLNGQSVR